MSLQTTVNWCGRCGAREPSCVVPVCFWGCLGSFGVACFVWGWVIGAHPQVETAVGLSLLIDLVGDVFLCLVRLARSDHATSACEMESLPQLTAIVSVRSSKNRACHCIVGQPCRQRECSHVASFARGHTGIFPFDLVSKNFAGSDHRCEETQKHSEMLSLRLGTILSPTRSDGRWTPWEFPVVAISKSLQEVSTACLSFLSSIMWPPRLSSALARTPWNFPFGVFGFVGFDVLPNLATKHIISRSIHWWCRFRCLPNLSTQSTPSSSQIAGGVDFDALPNLATKHIIYESFHWLCLLQ